MARKPTNTAKPSYVPPPHAPPERKLVIEDVLTPEEIETIKESARRKIAARDKMDAEERLLRAEMERLDKESHPEVFKEIRGITIDLALYADRVILDGKQYYPGRRYEVPKDVYDVLCEVEQSTFRHEQEIRSGSGSDAFYRRERNITLNTRTGEAVTAQGQPVRY